MFAMSRGLRALSCLFLAAILAACATTSQNGLQPVKSPNDDYSYRYLTLANDLQVLLISDPGTPKAAAALAVQVGSGDNPPDRGGLAHFLEHMLFLGTEKYPNAADYERFITEHGGNRNAYTSFELTNYFFDINAPYLPEALDRFAQFFIAPQFDAQYVDREKNAVEAEYQMGLKSDGRRGLDVLQEVMNPEHPYSRFAVGSLESLGDREASTVRDDLLRFYDKYYSANAMSLVVLGAQSLDELEALVTPMFEQVPNNARQVETVAEPYFTPGSLPMLLQVEPQAALRDLNLTFPISEYRPYYRENPLSYLGNLIGHEGEGSLLSRLKEEGLAESLGAGAGLAWQGGALFSIDISLTEKGVAEYERVMQLVFAYVDMLRVKGPREWLYEEQAQLAELGFRYAEHGSPAGYVTSLASGMHYYDPVDAIRGPYLMANYDAELLADLIDEIRQDNVLVTLTDASVSTDRESRHYQVPYAQSDLDPLLLAIADDDPALKAYRLPKPNEFIAEDVELVKLPAPVPDIPQVALENDRQKIWFMPDDEFRVPKGALSIRFRNAQARQTAEQAMLLRLYTALLMDRVNEFAYPALLAGLRFNFQASAQGMTLNIRGYNDKQLLLLERLLSDITDPDFSPQRFDNIRDDQVRALENTVAMRPSSQVMSDLKEALLHGSWSEEEKIAALKAADLDALAAYVELFWRDSSAETLLYGNFERSSVQQVARLLGNLLPAGKAPAMEDLEVTKLAPGDAVQYTVDVPHDDSVVAWYLQGDGKGWTERAATGMTGQIMTSGFFQQLRTEQQLGYVVSAFSWGQRKVPGLVMLVQSPVADAASVAQAMDAFMRAVPGELDAEQFERHKVSLISDILRPDKNIAERASFYWQSIARKQLDFAGRQHLVAAVEALTLEQWLEYYQRVFLNQRHSLQVVAPGKWGTYPLGDWQQYENAAAIKDSHETYKLK